MRQDIDVPDRKSLGQQLAPHEEPIARLGDPIARRRTGAFLRDDDSPLPVYRPRVQRRLARHFAQDHQPGADGLVGGVGQVQLVHGLVERGEGVGVRAKGQAEAFQDRQQITLWNVRRAVEGHVFDEVREAPLVFRLHQGARVDVQSQRRLAGRAGVMHDRVPHPVGKGPEAHLRVSRDVTCGLRPGRSVARGGFGGGKGGLCFAAAKRDNIRQGGAGQQRRG